MRTFIGYRLGYKLTLAIAALMVLSVLPGRAGAVGLEPGERINVTLAVPVENDSGFRVWGSHYFPGDVLSEKMGDYLMRKLRVIPRATASKVEGGDPAYWAAASQSPDDVIIRINLERFDYQKKDRLGSKVMWDVILHMYVYNASTRKLLYDSVIEDKDERTYILYNDVMESGPVYWDMFEKSPYWPAIRHTLDGAFAEVLSGYSGYRVIGQIVAKAERVDGSLSVPKKKQDKLYHVNIGREDSLKVGDVLSVTRASSVRTVAEETPEMHFPQIVARVKVVFIKGLDAVVEVVKESKDAPIQLGDSVSAPLIGARNGRGF